MNLDKTSADTGPDEFPAELTESERSWGREVVQLMMTTAGQFEKGETLNGVAEVLSAISIGGVAHATTGRRGVYVVSCMFRELAKELEAGQ